MGPVIFRHEIEESEEKVVVLKLKVDILKGRRAINSVDIYSFLWYTLRGALDAKVFCPVLLEPFLRATQTETFYRRIIPSTFSVRHFPVQYNRIDCDSWNVLMNFFPVQEHGIETFLIKRDEPLRPKQKHRGLLPPRPRRTLRTPSMILNAGLLASALSSVNHRLSRDASQGTLGLSASSDRDSRHSSGDSSAHSDENGTPHPGAVRA